MQFFSTDEITQNNHFFLAQHLKNVECRSHLHYSLEIVIVTEGELAVILDDQRYALEKGDGIFIMPFQYHSFVTEKDNSSAIFTFSSALVGEFADFINEKQVANPLFNVTNENLALCKDFDCNISNDVFYIKSLLYPLCRNVYDGCTFTAGGSKSDSSFLETIKYIYSHYSEEISLVSTAEALGFNSKYLSRMFTRSCGMYFSDFLNAVRCSSAANKIEDPLCDKNLSEIAFESGFTSIRNFNRTFKKFHGITPRELKNAKLKTRS